MTKEFHSEPFDEETLTKLRLYEAYIKSWLPVFMTNSVGVSSIWLFDLFCGPGNDCNGIKGSPLILLDELRKYLNCSATKHPPQINIVFNDLRKWKIRQLQDVVQSAPTLPSIVSIDYYSVKYSQIFPLVTSKAEKRDTACFVFIDQCGVNAIEGIYLKQLASFPITDWLAFVASSQARRFIEHESIKLQLTHRGEWRDAHRTVADTCRRIISVPNYYIVPFSLKKGCNVHGLLFGSGHPKGAEIFINACWAEDKNAGEANFDIDGNIQNSSRMLKLIPSKKLDAFDSEFKACILEGLISNTLEAYQFALQFGVRASHARDCLKRMKSDGLIASAPPLSYSSVISQGNIKPIKLIK